MLRGFDGMIMPVDKVDWQPTRSLMPVRAMECREPSSKPAPTFTICRHIKTFEVQTKTGSSDPYGFHIESICGCDVIYVRELE